MFIYGFMIKRCACLYVEVTLQTQTTLPHLRLRIIKMQAYFLVEKMEAYKNKATYLIGVNVTNTFQHQKKEGYKVNKDEVKFYPKGM